MYTVLLLPSILTFFLIVGLLLTQKSTRLSIFQRSKCFLTTFQLSVVFSPDVLTLPQTPTISMLNLTKRLMDLHLQFIWKMLLLEFSSSLSDAALLLHITFLLTVARGPRPSCSASTSSCCMGCSDLHLDMKSTLPPKVLEKKISWALNFRQIDGIHFCY